MSESAPAVQQQFNGYNQKAVGTPMEKAEIRIDGEPNKNHGEILIKGSEIRIDGEPNKNHGEILIKGRAIMCGYYKKPLESSKTFSDDGSIRSGDLGRIDDNGCVYIVGRKKELLITRAGENVTPHVIEENIKSLGKGFIRDAIVMGDGELYLVALLTLERQDLNLNKLSDRWDKALNGQTDDIKEVVKNKTVLKIIDGIMMKANEIAVNNVYRIKKWAILDTIFTVEGGEITNTLKVKRNVTFDK
eukprot:CAMPEP_0116986822 /NCGR_PEP_ID=MMETSP0467-20121206/63122_1 /TAXON_ID=283647 /ORGANISM="Mesodinium pulex, Strain SPMC105" /LENGTH=245 /DNA_ID=CAMNT_0004682489 /DNA_START=1157 /DNA_END=1894 /DNA_ORIENTATION=-